MNDEKFLEQLENLIDDDFDAGFLSELKQQAPEELHSRVMNSIRQESRKGRRVDYRRFDYRKYISVTAAALMLFALLGGGRSFVFEKLGLNSEKQPKMAVQNKVKSDPSKQTVGNSNSSTAQEFDLKNAPAGNQTGKPHKDSEKESTFAAAAKVSPDKSLNSKDDNNEVKVKINRKSNTDKLRTAVAMTSKKVITSTEADSKKSDSDNGNVATVTDSQDQDNVLIDVSADKLKNQVDYALKEPSKTFAITTTESSIAKIPQDFNIKNYTIASISQDTLSNYEIDLNMGQTYIIQFIKERGFKLSEGIYKLNKSDFDMLSQILSQNNISMKKMNDQIDQSVIVKMVVY